MALAPEQKAMLQLMLERGQSYEEIAGLLGGTQDDVRRRARAALTELAGSDPDAEVGLTDYMLGQADPIGRADVVRHLQADPASLDLARELSAKLRLIAPDAELPTLPEPSRRRRTGARTPPVIAPSPAAEEVEPGGEARSPLTRLSRRQARLLAAIGATATIVLFAALAIAGVFEGGETAATEGAGATAGGDLVSEEITTVPLRDSGGGDASGEAKFGIANETQPFMELRLAGLEQPPEGKTYVVWFLLSDEQGYPLAPLTGLTEDGTLNDRFAIPQAALPVAVRTRFIDIALVRNQRLAGNIQEALQGREVLLDYVGQSILRGRVPRLEAPIGEAGDLAPPGEDEEPAEGDEPAEGEPDQPDRGNGE